MNILNKPVLVLLACCLFCIGESVYTNNLKGLLSHKDRSRRINSQLDAAEKCICYKKKPEAISVADQLDKGNGLERLVVYFFIDPHTNETFMYVPDVEKQTLMPDLSFEKGDDLKNIVDLTNENIVNHRNAVQIKTPKKVNNITPAPQENQNSKTINDLKDFNVANQDDKDKFKNPSLMDPNVEIMDITNFNNQNGLNDKVSFDKWFNNQIKAVQMDPVNTNDMDIKLVKKLIENTLTENEMTVSEGKLKDEEGNVLDMAKLQLRPILIGDSVRYDNLLQNQDKFSLPLDFPYLKSLLVTIKDPSKILSIVPLGKMYLPKDAVVQSPSDSPKRNITDKITKIPFPEKLITKENNVQSITCTGDHCQLKKGDQILREHDVFTPASNHTKSNQYSDLENLANNLLKKETKNKKKEIKNEIKEIFDENRRLLGSKRRRKYYKNDIPNYSNELNKVFKTKSLIFPVFKRLNNDLHVNVNKKNLKPLSKISDEEVYIDDLEEPGLDDEYPGFRIMGGQPVLGSGQPINIRGRSGWGQVH